MICGFYLASYLSILNLELVDHLVQSFYTTGKSTIVVVILVICIIGIVNIVSWVGTLTSSGDNHGGAKMFHQVPR